MICLAIWLAICWYVGGKMGAYCDRALAEQRRQQAEQQR